MTMSKAARCSTRLLVKQVTSVIQPQIMTRRGMGAAMRLKPLEGMLRVVSCIALAPGIMFAPSKMTCEA